MITKIKKFLYFPVAFYFRFFAKIQLFFWQPRIIVITGSNSKTTLLHLLESQLGSKAVYSHHANSSFGIPFDILGLKRRTLTLIEWPYLFLMAPIKAFKPPLKQRIYIVEADCDRPNEGKFLATLLKPEVTFWLSSSNTHCSNFDSLVSIGKFKSITEAIAFEFGYFIEYTSKLSILNGDNSQILKQISRTKSKVEKIITDKFFQKYELGKNETKFQINGKEYLFRCLLPEDTFYAILGCLKFLDYLDIEPDIKFSNFSLPPGRSSLFKGIKNTTIIDSSYNATPASMQVILETFKKYPASKKWLVLGDIVELGKEEQVEHERLVPLIKSIKAKKIILIGPRLSKYSYQKLEKDNVWKFDGPKEALDFLKNNINGGEVLLFKGARFLEGIIEHLLKNKEDINKLCRREKVWQERRKKWGL